MKRLKLFLGGYVTGYHYDTIMARENHVRAMLRPLFPDSDLEINSCMRGKEYLADSKVPLSDAYPQHALSTASAIVDRDFSDVRTSDVLLFFLKGATHISQMTLMEIGAGEVLEKPMVIVMDENDQIHTHAALKEIASRYPAQTLDGGINRVKTIIRKLQKPERFRRKTTMEHLKKAR